MRNMLKRGCAAVALSAAIAAQAETVYDVVCTGADGVEKWRDTATNRVTTAGLNKLLDATFKTGLASPAWYVGLVASSATDAAITTGTANLTSASNPWTAADAGRVIIVQGAAAGGADLVTTILTYSSAGAVVLAANAGRTVSAALAAWECRVGDTMASHAPWTTSVAYSQATRPAFTAGTPSGGSVDNSGSPAVFSMNPGSRTFIGGLFLVDNNVLGGTTGTLYGMALFSAGFKACDSGDTLTVTVTPSITST